VETCPQCGNVGDLAHSDALDAVVCLACYEAQAPTAAVGGLEACPRCRDQRGGRYGREGTCWPCYARRHPSARRSTPEPEPKRWQVFREWVISSMLADGCWHYMGPDRCAGRCPICDEPMTVRFGGRTPEADIECAGGCATADVVRALGKALAVGS
jgi:hypothetical protein